MKICIFGLGEAGSLFAADLIAAGAEVAGYDPAEVVAPDGLRRAAHPALAVRRAELIMSFTAAADAGDALLQAIDAVDRSALYADMSTAPPSLKIELAQLAERRGIGFVDGAMMALVPGNGVSTPCLASGPGAHRFADTLNLFGGAVEPLDAPAGVAAGRKLLRSSAMKGIAAVLIESARAGTAAADLEWLWAHLGDEFGQADQAWMTRLVTGTGIHSARRLDEMTSVRDMLIELGVDPIMTTATVESLRHADRYGVPTVPDASVDHGTRDESRTS